MSTHYDRRTTTIPTPSDEPTSASAWASSQLGDPGIDDGYGSDFDDFGFDGTDPVSKPRSAGKIALIAVAAAGAIGAGVALGSVLFGGGSSQPNPTGVVPGASVHSVSPNAPGAVPPPAVPAPTAAVSSPDPGQAPAATNGIDGNAPAAADPTDGGAPAAPGVSAPAATDPTDGGAPAAPGVSAPAATDPTDGGSDPAPQAGPGYASGPSIIVSPNLNMPGGGGQYKGPGKGGKGGKPGTTGNGPTSGGNGLTNIPSKPILPPQKPIKLPPGIKFPSEFKK